MNTSIDPAADLRRRFVPSEQAVAAAKTALTANPAADVAVLPIYLPGKQYGMWELGQRVETVDLPAQDVLIGMNDRADCGGLPTVRQCVNLAYELAATALAQHGCGTTAYAVVHRDGRTRVFEEILSA